MSAAVNTTALFELAEASVPDRSQTFAAVLETLQATLTTLRSTLPTGATQQLYTISALYGLQLLVILASLGLRFRAGDRWLFRVVRCRFGTYIAPNAGTLWQLFIAIFLIAVEVLMWMLVHFQSSVPAGYSFGIVVILVAFWFAALSAMWSMAVSQAEVASRSNIKPKLWQRPIFIHAVFIGYPLVEVVSMCVMGGLVNRALFAERDAIASTMDSLSRAAAAATSLSPAQLDSAIALQVDQTQSMFNQLASRYRLLIVSGGVTLAHCLTTWILYLVVAVPYLLALRKQIFQPVQGADYQELRYSFYSAAATCTALSVATLGFAGIESWQVTTSQAPALVESALAFHWLFSVLGLPLCIGALARSMALRRTNAADNVQASSFADSNARSLEEMQSVKLPLSMAANRSPRLDEHQTFELAMERRTAEDEYEAKLGEVMLDREERL